MKRLITFFAIAFFAIVAFAQSPEQMSYQAIVRNANGKLLTNQQIGVQISILQGFEDEKVVQLKEMLKVILDNIHAGQA